MKITHHYFFLLMLLPLLLAGCGEPVTATPNPVEVGATMFADKINAEATQAKLDGIFTATAQVMGATATQQAAWVQATATQQARIDAQATANKADANAQATADQARRDAQATQRRVDAEATQQAVHAQATQMRLDFEATQAQARLDLQATQQAQGTATAWSVTQAVIPLHDSWTQQAVQKDILLATNEVELSNLQVQQQRDTNVLDWLAPLSAAIFALLVGSAYLLRMSKVREVKDEDGTVRMVVFNNQRAIVPTLLPGPVVELETGLLPAVVDQKEQSEIVKRDQAIRALGAMPVHPTSDGVQAFNGVFSGLEKKSLPVIEVIQPGQIENQVLDDLEGQVMEEEEG